MAKEEVNIQIGESGNILNEEEILNFIHTRENDINDTDWLLNTYMLFKYSEDYNGKVIANECLKKLNELDAFSNDEVIEDSGYTLDEFEVNEATDELEEIEMPKLKNSLVNLNDQTYDNVISYDGNYLEIFRSIYDKYDDNMNMSESDRELLYSCVKAMTENLEYTTMDSLEYLYLVEFLNKNNIISEDTLNNRFINTVRSKVTNYVLENQKNENVFIGRIVA